MNGSIMYCTSCGTENDVGARFCKSCGKAMAEPGPGAGRFEPELPGGTGPPIHVPNYLVQAILVTIFCCLPFGIVSIVYAAQVNGKIASGDVREAMRLSKQAKLWVWVSFGTGIAIYGIFVILPVLALFGNY